MDKKKSLFGSIGKLYESDHEALVSEAKLVENGSLWEDPDFYGGDALYIDWTRPPKGCTPYELIEWNRINEYEVSGCSDPIFINEMINNTTENFESSILNVGIGKDSWFISALALLCPHKDLLQAVFVSGRNAKQGIYTLKFWKNDRWVYIHVDDRLPCSRLGDPLYSSCENRNHIWIAVAEKAYAKLHGCYENLENGYLTYALKDLVGSPYIQEINFRQYDGGVFQSMDAIWPMLLAATKNGCPVSITQHAPPRDKGDGGHSGGRPAHRNILGNLPYSILKCIEEESTSTGEIIRLVQILNPWGQRDWTGVMKTEKLQEDSILADDRDDSTHVTTTPHNTGERTIKEDFPDLIRTLKQYDYYDKLNGDLNATYMKVSWIRFDEILQWFDKLHLIWSPPKDWKNVIHKGQWTRDSDFSGSGGMHKNDLFDINPQYSFEIKSLIDPDHSDQEDGQKELYDIAVSLSLRDLRLHDGVNVYPEPIGFLIASVDSNKLRLHSLGRRKVCGGTLLLRKLPQVAAFIKLPPGRYTIIPFTLNTQRYMSFQLYCTSDYDLNWLMSPNVPLSDVYEEESDVEDHGYNEDPDVIDRVIRHNDRYIIKKSDLSPSSSKTLNAPDQLSKNPSMFTLWAYDNTIQVERCPANHMVERETTGIEHIQKEMYSIAENINHLTGIITELENTVNKSIAETKKFET